MKPARVWFLVPRENEPVRRAAAACMRQLTLEVRARVEVVELESLLRTIQREVSHDLELAKHFGEFERKYVIPPNPNLG